MRFRFLLQPGWIALTLAVWVFATACFTLLAPWQFRRDAERETQNSAITKSIKSEPVPLQQSHDEWQKVVLKGTYRPEHEALARLRTVQGEAAFEVLTPFETTDGTTVLIDRGYVRPVNGMKPPTYPEPPKDQVTVVALQRPNESDARPAFEQDGKWQVYSINTEAVAPNMRPGYFQITEDQPGTINALPLPQLDAGPFFSYALQWIAFGVMAIGGWAYFSWREIQPGGALTQQKQKRKSIAELLAAEEGDESGQESRTEADDPGQLHGSRHVT
ncbi:SURF1-like protein [Lentzea sp. NBRC 105346]|uniref:SURF1 family cytochrome oxidase biogenesis protein n=1 Tax=Lentzea sp. NBRC 105346 TaxID=3032205 RepID=UPI0024A477A9|nr:SURF1 family cytochrome oxidase biogenesis protein [Lentzea sp. NBRC 105346]GLZ35874.1 SURF1-like protein [Lentzea sp. NBRC 105346]